MIKTILVDDEPFALDELEFFLRQYDDIYILQKYSNPVQALTDIKIAQPDIVFLDIEMPELDGLNLAEHILEMKNNIGIVFLTAHNAYAIKAFEIAAIDYILKPIEKKRLDLTLQRIKQKLVDSTFKNSLEQKSTIREQAILRNLKKVPIWKEDKIILLNPSDIFYFTAYEKEVSVIAKQETELTSTNSLNYWENKLRDHKFFRCHRSFLVNMDKVEEIVPTFSNTYTLKLKGISEDIPVSRKSFIKLKELLDL